MKITDLYVVYICPDHNPKYAARKTHMDTMLRSIGFQHIEHYKSGTENYPDCLSLATIDILTKYMDRPVLFLEDDVEWTGVTEFEMDPSADAIYFGLSRCGGSKTRNHWEGQSQFTPHSETLARVQNMLGAHAILYITPAYKQAVINALKAHMGVKYNGDVLMSRLQSNFTVLALKKPAFFQSNKFNTADLEKVTRFSIL
jgi:hypothetical protein